MTKADPESSPTVEECADAAGKLLLMFDIYCGLDRGGSPTHIHLRRPAEIGRRLKKVIAAVAALWEHVNRIQRNDEIRRLHQLLVDFYQQCDVDASLPESCPQDLADYWDQHSLYPLTVGQLAMLTGPVDRSVPADRDGPEQRAKYRLGKLFDLDWRQMHNIVTAEPKAWGGFNYLLGNPLRMDPPLDIARRSAVSFLAHKVLGVDMAELVRLVRPDAISFKRRDGILVKVGWLEGPGAVSERLEEAMATELIDFIKERCAPEVYDAVMQALSA
jgi:hypothetical protein